MKKTLLLIVCVLFTFSAFSQDNSFAVLNGKLVWENVIISQETNIPAIISRHSKLAITSADGDIYKGKATGLTSACSDASKLLKCEYCFNFEIQMSEGKYRVTVMDIVFTGTGVGAAEKYYIAKGALLQTAAASNDLDCIDAYFCKIFTMTSVYKNKP